MTRECECQDTDPVFSSEGKLNANQQKNSVINNESDDTLSSNHEPKNTLRQFYNPSIMDGVKCTRKSVKSIINKSEILNIKRHNFNGCIIKTGEQAAISNDMDIAVNIGCMRHKTPKELELEAQAAALKPKSLEVDDDNDRYLTWLRQISGDSLPFDASKTETLSAFNMTQDKILVLDVYVDPEDDYNKIPPQWICTIDRVNGKEYGIEDRIYFQLFVDYFQKERFWYGIYTSGLYESNPRLVRNWTSGNPFIKPEWETTRSFGSESSNNRNISDLFPPSPGKAILV